MVVMSRSTGRKYPSFATKMRCIATVNSWKVKWPSPSMSDNFLQRSKKNLDFSTFDTSDSFGSPSPPTPCGLGTRLDSIILALVVALFPGLQSPNAVEGLVKLLRRMTSSRRWVYIWVDVWRRGTSGEVQSAAR